MLICYDYRRGIKNLTRKSCPPRQVCQATWHHTIDGSTDIMWQGCSPINQTKFQRCGKGICTLFHLVDDDTSSNCTRGPSARCCCTTSLCNEVIISHGPDLYNRPCYHLPKAETSIGDSSTLSRTFTVIFFPLVAVLITIILLTWIKKMTSRYKVEIRHECTAEDNNVGTTPQRSQHIHCHKLRICKLITPLRFIAKIFAKKERKSSDEGPETFS